MRRVVLVLVVTGLSLGAFAKAASAASETTDCSGLQAALDQAQNGDTITLNQLCTGDDFNLDDGATRSYTLQGQAGSGAGFDGTGSSTSMVHAIGGSGSFTVSNLVFQNSPAAPARDGGALVFLGDYSVTADHDTFTNNQVGSGGSGGALAVETSVAGANVTLSNDSFTGNQSIGTGGLASGGAANISTTGAGSTITLSGDTFNHNTTAVGGQGGAMEILAFGAGQSLTVSGSTFTNNTTNSAGGAFELFTGSPVPVTMTGNTFSGNAVDGCGSGCELDGGGVAIINAAPGTAQVTQSANTFTGNSITGGTSDANGGGEAVIGETLRSTGDVFNNNTLRAPVSGQSSFGAGLAIQHDCGGANQQSTATNLVAAGNSIADGGAGSANGAVSSSCIGGTSGGAIGSLALNNATISGNRGGGGTAGVWGESEDQLSLQNSILTGNSDGVDVTGFLGLVTATYTDLCNGSSPFTGTGNICADPKLANAANGDVHETGSSPTIDAGSNPLVPNGLNTDVYGAKRIQPRTFGGAPVVDMGAAEWPSTPLPPSASISTPSNGATYALGEKVNASYTCAEGGGGPGISSCSGPVANGSPIDTSTTGSHTFTVTATSSDGQAAAARATYTVAAAPSILIAAPLSGATYIRGNSVVLAGFSCHEGASGPGLSSCVGTVPNGKRIDTNTPGTHTFTVTARSSDGQVTTSSIRYRVVFPSNKPVKPPHVKPHADGRFIVTVKVPHRGRVDILVTAWKDNFAPGFGLNPRGGATDIGPPKPVLLQPAKGRFVFARAHKTFNTPGTYQILVTPNRLGRILVAHHRYRVTLRLWISYTPWGGHPGKIGYFGLHLPAGLSLGG